MAEEMILAPVAIGVGKKKLTDSEQKLMLLLDKADTVEVVIPQDIKLEDFRVALSAVCKNLVRAELNKETLYPVLGQLMMVAKLHPELWNSKQENYEGFIAATSEEFGVSRSTLMESRQMIERWGDVISMPDFQLIGRVRLKSISREVPKGAEKETTARKLLKVAATGTVKELDSFIEANYHKSRQERIGATFEIPCNKSEASAYGKFFGNPYIQAYCGSEKWSEILNWLIAECAQTWKDEGAVKAKQAEEAVVA